MASYIKRGEKLLIPFRNGISIGDSQCKPRMYKTMTSFRKNFPGYSHSTKGVEVVEYKEVVHGRWIIHRKGQNNWCECSECNTVGSPFWKRCPVCEAKMNGGNEDG